MYLEPDMGSSRDGVADTNGNTNRWNELINHVLFFFLRSKLVNIISDFAGTFFD